MKKQFTIWISLCLMFLFSGLHATAAEKPEYTFFGVGAEVSPSSDGTSYTVKTQGKKENEGIVFTPSNIQGGQKVSVELDLKGTEEVFIKIEETDARGTFIKETSSQPIRLTDDWQPLKLDALLSPTTKQIDVMLLTRNKATTEFLFKNVKVSKP